MRAFFDLSVEERKSIGHAARARVARNYSLDIVVKQYEDLFQALAA
jgi:glycosyltransferase involved in cell wall biosynthesis